MYCIQCTKPSTAAVRIAFANVMNVILFSVPPPSVSLNKESSICKSTKDMPCLACFPNVTIYYTECLCERMFPSIHSVVDQTNCITHLQVFYPPLDETRLKRQSVFYGKVLAVHDQDHTDSLCRRIRRHEIQAHETGALKDGLRYLLRIP